MIDVNEAERQRIMSATIRRGMPFAEYLALPSVHFSALRHIETSPRHYRRAVSHGRADTSSLRLGRMTHAMILTPTLAASPESAPERVVYGGSRRGKAWLAFAAEHRGKVIVTAAEVEREAEEAERANVHAHEMRAAIHAHPRARELLASGEGEVTIQWEDLPGLRCRARMDWLRHGREIVELKTGRSIAPRPFARECAARYYHAQIAFYTMGLDAADHEPDPLPPPSIVAVENQPPYDVAVYRVGVPALDAGRRKVDGWLKTLAACEASGQWPGIGGDDAIDLVLPEWAEAEGLEEPDMGAMGEEPNEDG